MKTIGIILLLITIFIQSVIPQDCKGWNQSWTENPARPYFTTHQWLAYESLHLSPSSSRIQWITNNLLDFWHGIESPYYADSAAPYIPTYADDYGDIGDLVLYLDSAGTTVTNDSLAARADEEYDKLVTELAKDDADFTLAAFYAGAMCHYISQAGVWGTIWDETLWGILIEDNWTNYERQIDNGLDAYHFEQDQEYWTHNFFTLSPSLKTSVEAYDATINLAQNIHPIAQSQANDFEDNWSTVEDWSNTYRNDTLDCLTYSVEAMYAALDQAMIDVNWKTITIEDPIYTYDELTCHLEIPDFSVNYTDNSGTYTLIDTDVELAEFRIIVFPEEDWEDTILSPEREDLVYNASTQKWYHPDHLVKGTFANRIHSILYCFKMNKSSLTFGNKSSIDFSVNFYKFNLTNIDTDYTPNTRTLSIRDVVINLYELPEIGELEPSEVISAQWKLYTKGEGIMTIDANIGVPAFDTEGKQPHGNLTYDNVEKTWYSLDNDIGLVHTQLGQLYFVTVEFEIDGIPVGYYKNSSYGQSCFIPTCFAQDSTSFKTRPHYITITKPDIVFDSETNTLSAYNITAFSDYQNTVLDEYEMHIKQVFGNDVRKASWEIYTRDGMRTYNSGILQWDSITESWYMEDFIIENLPDGQYYVSAKFETMNTNASLSLPGSPSQLFTIDLGRFYMPSNWIPIVIVSCCVVVLIIVIVATIKIVKKGK